MFSQAFSYPGEPLMVYEPIHYVLSSDQPLWCQELKVAYASQSEREDELKM